MSFGAILGIIMTFGSGILVYFGFRKTNESNNLSRYVPADKISSIPFGVPVVAAGTVTADQPLTSPVTQKQCVYFAYSLERETEVKDDKGNTSWQWRTVGTPEKQSIPFYLQDTSGKILIKPDNCEVNGIYRTQQFLQQGTIENAKSTGMKILAAAIQMTSAASGNRERVTEYTIFTGATLNVFGALTMEGEQKFFQKTTEYPLVLSPLSKDQLVSSERKNAFIFYVLAALLLIVGMILIFKN
jgi:E3 Ubiquitin ligase